MSAVGQDHPGPSVEHAADHGPLPRVGVPRTVDGGVAQIGGAERALLVEREDVILGPPDRAGVVAGEPRLVGRHARRVLPHRQRHAVREARSRVHVALVDGDPAHDDEVPTAARHGVRDQPHATVGRHHGVPLAHDGGDPLGREGGAVHVRDVRHVRDLVPPRVEHRDLVAACQESLDDRRAGGPGAAHDQDLPHHDLRVGVASPDFRPSAVLTPPAGHDSVSNGWLVERGVMASYDVVVIGAGAAGLTAGALLANEGKRVVRRRPQRRTSAAAAWRCRTRASSSTSAATCIEDSGSGITKVFEHVGKKLVHGEVSADMPVWDHEKHGWGSIRDRYTGNKAELKKVIKALMDTPYEELDAWDDRPLREWMHQHTDDQGVIDLFEFISVLECMTDNWYDHSRLRQPLRAQDALRGARTAAYSFWPGQGWDGHVADLRDAVIEHGGEVRLGTPVERVVIEDGEVKGVVIGREQGAAERVPRGGDPRGRPRDLDAAGVDTC